MDSRNVMAEFEPLKRASALDSSGLALLKSLCVYVIDELRYSNGTIPGRQYTGYIYEGNTRLLYYWNGP